MINDDDDEAIGSRHSRPRAAETPLRP